MSEIKHDKRNYRKHSERNRNLINKSLKELGAGRSILIDNENEIIAGNGVFEEARGLNIPVKIIETDGSELIAIKRKDLATRDRKRQELAIMDNSTSDSSEFDFGLLLEDFEEPELLEMGIEYEDLEGIINNEPFESEEDIAPEPQDQVISKAGDLWILGNHRLLCGDATKIEDVQKLMDGKIADMVFTDPPYNVKVSNISGRGKNHHSEFAMASGEMSEQEFIDFLSDVFKNLVSVSKDGSIHYICMDWKHIYEIISAGRSEYTEFKQLCVWNKGVGGMGAFYRSQHELIFVFKNGTATHTNNFGLGENGRFRTNVWDYAGMNTFSPDRDELLRAAHPTVKPVKLVGDAIFDCSNHGETILDLFGGSGTTMIACEQLNRKCYMMEIDSKYCDVIIRRWQKQTNQKAILEASGKSFDELAGEL